MTAPSSASQSTIAESGGSFTVTPGPDDRARRLDEMPGLEAHGMRVGLRLRFPARAPFPARGRYSSRPRNRSWRARAPAQAVWRAPAACSSACSCRRRPRPCGTRRARLASHQDVEHGRVGRLAGQRRRIEHLVFDHDPGTRALGRLIGHQFVARHRTLLPGNGCCAFAERSGSAGCRAIHITVCAIHSALIDQAMRGSSWEFLSTANGAMKSFRWKPGRAAISGARKASSATGSRPTARRASRPRPGATTSISRTTARGPIAC